MVDNGIIQKSIMKGNISMTKKRKFSREFKESVLNEHDETGISYWQLGKKYGIDAKTIRTWRNNRNAFGAESLEHHNCNLCNYTADYKKKVVEYCLSEKATYQATALKFGILAPSTVRKWVKQYNSHIELTLSRPDGKERSMANKIPVRKTSFEERVEIVKYCIEHEHNYSGTAIQFNVSYGQVYSWVRKYEQNGVDALTDRRGKHCSEEPLSEIDKLRAENKLLRAKEKQQQMEIDFLKKVEEIERR